MRRGRCCCGGCTNILKLVNGCGVASPLASTAFSIRSWDGATEGPVVASGSTDASGEYPINLPEGDYALRVKPGNPAEAFVVIHATCGATVQVPYYGRAIQWQATQCGSVSPLPGAVFTISGVENRVITADASGVVRWYPMVPGAYSFTVTKGGGYYGTYSGTGTVPANPCLIGFTPIPITVPPANGFTCCDFITTYPGNVRINRPRGPLKVVTSAGDSWYIGSSTSCTDSRCSYSDEVSVYNSSSGSTSPGVVSCWVDIGRIGTGATWTAAIRPPSYVPPGAFYDWDCEQIVRSGNQSGGSLNSWMSGVATLVSVDPLFVTFSFGGGLMPAAISSITITEELP